ncbi:MAG: ChrR family anti-sigma-E factor [Lautropia sp.]
MTIEHHPDDSLLIGFAAGTLDHGQHVAIATHLVSCPRCRAFMHAMERVGGEVLSGLAPAAMSPGALAAVESRLTAPAPAPVAPRASTVTEQEIPALPTFVRHYRFGSWKWLAPAVHLRPIVLPHASETRVFLLRSGPGTRMLPHSHTGLEMTCVLSGAFSQDGAHYGPGDFDMGDDTIEHRPVVEEGQDCLCLVAMRGELELHGWLGRLMQPFVRL